MHVGTPSAHAGAPSSAHKRPALEQSPLGLACSADCIVLDRVVQFVRRMFAGRSAPISPTTKLDSVPDEFRSGTKLLPAASDEIVWISHDIAPETAGGREDAVSAGEGLEGQRSPIAKRTKP